MRLSGKVIIVTGSTRGIGRGIVEMLSAEGARVVISGRNLQDGQDVVNGIIQAGGEAFFVPANISIVADCRRLVDTAIEKYGHLYGLVNNAAIFPRIPFMEVNENMFDTIMATDIKGAFFCTQQALGYMIRQQSGSIVNIGSTHWQISSAELPVYGIAKAALHTLTRHISHYFAKDGIRSNWISVGWVLSPGEKELTLTAGHDIEWLKIKAKEIIPSGRLQTPEDIANACVYLLSDESSQVTGTDIEVTGGMLDG